MKPDNSATWIFSFITLEVSFLLRFSSLYLTDLCVIFFKLKICVVATVLIIPRWYHVCWLWKTVYFCIFAIKSQRKPNRLLINLWFVKNCLAIMTNYDSELIIVTLKCDYLCNNIIVVKYCCILNVFYVCGYIFNCSTFR